MTAHQVPALNKKLEGFTNEELQRELAIRQAILSAWTGAPTRARTPPAPIAATAKEPNAGSTRTPKRRRARGRKATAKKGAIAKKMAIPATEAPKNGAATAKGSKRATPETGSPTKKRARRGISPSGKTTAQYAIEALAKAGGARAPAFLVPLMTKAGWQTKSPDPAAVVTTTLKKAAAQKKVKKADGKNEFRAA